MSTNFNYTDNNENVGVARYARLKRQQVGLLSRVFLLTSFLFVIAAAIMFGIIEYSQTYLAKSGFSFVTTPLFGIVSVIASSIVFFFMGRNIQRSLGANITYLTFFLLLLSSGIGCLLAAINNAVDGWLVTRLPVIFLIAGGSALVMGLFGLGMSNKTAASLSRFVFVGFISMFLFGLLASFVLYFVWPQNMGFLNFVYAIVGSLLVMCTIAVTVNQIRRTEEFLSFDGRSAGLVNALTIYYAASLVNSLIWLVWYLAQIFLRER